MKWTESTGGPIRGSCDVCGWAGPAESITPSDMVMYEQWRCPKCNTVQGVNIPLDMRAAEAKERGKA